MNEIALLTGLGLSNSGHDNVAHRTVYAVVRQHQQHQSGLLIDTDGKIFHFACDDQPPLALRPGVSISRQQWRDVVQSKQALLEQTSVAELNRLSRANERISNETLAPLSVGEHDSDNTFFVSISAQQEQAEPVILRQEGPWQRANEADEARVLNAFLVNKARQYDV